MERRIFLTFAMAVSLVSAARAEVALPAIFADHAVLQRDRPIPVWGAATPGEAVRVQLGEATVGATADADGRWRVELPARPAGGPFSLVVSGTNRLERTDVYVGEVWIASGQSNMEFTVSRSVKRWAGTMNEEAEIAAADHPMIRMFTVPPATSAAPVADVERRPTSRPSLAESTWQVCSPQTVPAFSAPGYFFARALVASQRVPVGIVVSAYGASTAQAWISRQSIAKEPTLAPMLADYDAKRADFASGAATRRAEEAIAAWAATTRASTAATQPRKPGMPKDLAKDQHSPTVCYNAMIAPIEAYAARGAIWYQGESNGIDNPFYLSLMTTLINDWRSRRAGPFPFIQVQLAGYRAPATRPTTSSQIANVREAQRLTMTSVPDSATVTAFDLGHRTNIHPDNKQEVGRRLALAARALAYGEAIEWSGPLLGSATIEDGAIRVRLTHARGLAVKTGATNAAATSAPTTPQSFALLNGDAWRFAEATIDGETIVVKLQPGERPTELRYAWADNPTTANVVNAEGLPMLPFRAELK